MGVFFLQFVYGCLYMLFEAYPIVFQVGHNMDAGSAGVCFRQM